MQSKKKFIFMQMKYTITITVWLLSFTAKSQTFNLSVNNGLGSGTFNEGDTIHVW